MKKAIGYIVVDANDGPLHWSEQDGRFYMPGNTHKVTLFDTKDRADVRRARSVRTIDLQKSMMPSTSGFGDCRIVPVELWND